MKKKVLTAILTSSMILGTFAGCMTASAEEDVTLTFWSPTWHQTADESVIADFEAANPNIHIDATFYSTADIKSNLKIAATSDTMPDMWYMWGGANYADYYYQAGLAKDLTEYAEANNWDEKFLPSAMELCKSADGAVECLPQVYTGLNVWYRKDIFEEYGLSVPTTFEELENVCATLKENGVTPFSVAGDYTFRITEALLEYYCGAEEHDALNALEASWADSEGVTKAMEKLKEWADLGYFIDGFITEDTANEKMYVYSGNAAMMVDNTSVASDVVANDYDPALYDYFVLPVGRVSAFVKITQFNKNLTDEQFEAAMKFWDYYLSNESIEAHTAIEQPTAVAGAPLSSSLALAEGYLEAINEAGSYTTTDLNVPDEVVSVLFSSEEKVVLGEIEPSEYGAEVQAAIDSYLANN
jgi:raffinose/stachyose/melibiose transport system substrate-binding protein